MDTIPKPKSPWKLDQRWQKEQKQDEENIKPIRRAQTLPRRSERLFKKAAQTGTESVPQSPVDRVNMSLKERYQGQILEDELSQYRAHIERLATRIEEQEKSDVSEARWFDLRRYGIEPRRREVGRVIGECEH